MDLMSYALSRKYTDKQLKLIGPNGAPLTAEGIILALGYEPVNDEDIQKLMQEIEAMQPETAGDDDVLQLLAQLGLLPKLVDETGAVLTDEVGNILVS